MQSGFTHRGKCLAAGTLLMVASGTASGQAQGLLDNRLVVNLGLFVVGTDVEANLNGQSVNNPAIDFDQTFGKARDATRGRLDVLWRINPRHHLRFLYFRNDSSRNRAIDRDIQWGDYTFQAGANVDSRIKYQIFELAYEYAFLRAPSYEVAVGAGLHVGRLTTRLSGNAAVTGAVGGAVSFQTQDNSVTAPLPVVGLRGGWVAAPQIYLDAQAQVFKFRINDVDGHWTDLRIGGTWMFHEQLGVGVAYNRFFSRVDLDKTSFDGNLKFGYGGVQVFLTGTF
jgi:hypothetical protein